MEALKLILQFIGEHPFLTGFVLWLLCAANRDPIISIKCSTECECGEQHDSVASGKPVKMKLTADGEVTKAADDKR